MRVSVIMAIVGTALCANAARAGAVYENQSRSITVFTSFDGASQTASAADFGPFDATISLSTPFPTPDGGVLTNVADAGIDCELDPNRIRLFGSLIAAGGISALPDGGTAIQFGQAAASAGALFQLTYPTPLRLTSLPRPNVNPEDKFTIKLRKRGGGGGGGGGNTEIVSLDETSAPQALNLQLLLLPGTYDLSFEVEVTVAGDEASSPYGLDLFLPSPDLTNDGAVNTADLALLLAHFGSAAPSGSEAARADINADGQVNTADLIYVLLGFPR